MFNRLFTSAMSMIGASISPLAATRPGSVVAMTSALVRITAGAMSLSLYLIIIMVIIYSIMVRIYGGRDVLEHVPYYYNGYYIV